MLRTLVLTIILLPTFALSDVINQKLEQPLDAKAAIANQAASAKLDARLPEVKLMDVDLIDAIDRLRDLTGAKIFVNWKALESSGVDRHTKVALHKKNVKLSAALDMLLAQAAEDEPLGVAVDDGSIVVSTRRDVGKYSLLTRVYDVRDLLRDAKDASRGKRVEGLVKFVTDQVDPPSWRSHGGDAGDIRELQGQLIVTQSPENHRALVRLLEGVKGWAFDVPADQQPFPLLKK